MAQRKCFKSQNLFRKGRASYSKPVDRLIETTEKERSVKRQVVRDKKRFALNIVPTSQSTTHFTPSSDSRSPNVRLPSCNSSTEALKSTPKVPASKIQHRQIKHQAIISGWPELQADFSRSSQTLDLRTENHADIPLVRLPRQPAIVIRDTSVPQGHFPFLDLPGEIKNKIYELAIPEETYAIHWYQDSKKTKDLTCCLPLRSKAYSPCLSSETIARRQSLRSNPYSPVRASLMAEFYTIPSQVSLLWVCRAMYTEASSIFYSKSTFQFYLLRTLRTFLDNLSPSNQQAIRTLHIHHKTYHHPSKFKDIACKHRADMAWEDICHKIARKCTSLTHLALDLNYYRAPIRFQELDQLNAHEAFGTRWLYAIWCFQGIDLHSCWLRIRSDVHEDTVLEVESQSLRRQILDEQWDDQEQARYDAFGSPLRPASRPKGKATFLRITNTDEVFGVA